MQKEISRVMSTRVATILQTAFPGSEVKVDRFHGAKRIHGKLVWSGFSGVEHIERQRRVYNLLRDKLGADAQEVSIILAYTPHEVEMMESV